MATLLENLNAAIDNIGRQLKDITENPKPDYSIDGESYSWNSLFTSLTNQLKVLEEARQRASGPFSVKSRGRV